MLDHEFHKESRDLPLVKQRLSDHHATLHGGRCSLAGIAWPLGRIKSRGLVQQLRKPFSEPQNPWTSGREGPCHVVLRFRVVQREKEVYATTRVVPVQPRRNPSSEPESPWTSGREGPCHVVLRFRVVQREKEVYATTRVDPVQDGLALGSDFRHAPGTSRIPLPVQVVTVGIEAHPPSSHAVGIGQGKDLKDEVISD